MLDLCPFCKYKISEQDAKVPSNRSLDDDRSSIYDRANRIVLACLLTLKALALIPERASNLDPVERSDLRFVLLTGCCIVIVPYAIEEIDPNKSSSGLPAQWAGRKSQVEAVILPNPSEFRICVRRSAIYISEIEKQSCF